MSLKSFGRMATVLVALGCIGSNARADEIVHFTNGAEMAVRSHVVTNEMLKLDLGGNNSISFPISMVDKIVNAGQNVFLNPVYYPSNQALPGVSAAPAADASVADSGLQGGYARGGFAPQPIPGSVPFRPGESANNVGSGAASIGRNPHDDMATVERPKFDPLRPLPPGGLATIEPAASLTQARRPAPRMSPRATELPPTTSPTGTQGGPPTPPPAQSGTDESDTTDSGGHD